MSPAKLMVHAQMALQLTQRELGALVGRDRRTIQRWQDKGCTALLAEEAAALIQALRPVRPDLADEVQALHDKLAADTGQPPLPRPVPPEVIDAILDAAAAAGGSSRKAVAAIVRAAFQSAAEAGVEAGAVVAAIEARDPPR
jgi:hypothetical protein